MAAGTSWGSSLVKGARPDSAAHVREGSHHFHGNDVVGAEGVLSPGASSSKTGQGGLKLEGGWLLQPPLNQQSQQQLPGGSRGGGEAAGLQLRREGLVALRLMAPWKSMLMSAPQAET